MKSIDKKENLKTIEEITKQGFSLKKINGGKLIITNRNESTFEYVGQLSPISTQLSLIKGIKYERGLIIFMKSAEPYFVTLEHFMLFETEVIPRSSMAMRDFFDYGLKEEICSVFKEVKPEIGPIWQYFYKTSLLAAQLKESKLKLSVPILGNGIICKGNNLRSVLHSHYKIKEAFEEIVPIPHAWLFPSNLWIDCIDNIYDSESRSWFVIRIMDKDVGINISLADLVRVDRGGKFEMHYYGKKEIRDVLVKPENYRLEIKQVGGKYQRNRKLSNLKVIVSGIQ
jgi:hypothetical protein